TLTPSYAGKQPDFAGLDQINVELPRSLIGRGVQDVIVNVPEATPSKAVQIEMGAAAGNFPLPRANDDFKTTDEDKPVAIQLVGQDMGGRPLHYLVTSLPTHGKLSGTAPDVVYTPEARYNGEDSFKFQVNNGVDGSTEGTIHLTVRTINHPPSLSVPGPQSVD